MDHSFSRSSERVIRLMGSERGRRAITMKTMQARPRTATPASHMLLLENKRLPGLATPATDKSCDGGADFCEASTGAGAEGPEVSVLGDAVSGCGVALVTTGSFGTIGAASEGCCAVSDSCSTFRSTIAASGTELVGGFGEVIEGEGSETVCSTGTIGAGLGTGVEMGDDAFADMAVTASEFVVSAGLGFFPVKMSAEAVDGGVLDGGAGGSVLVTGSALATGSGGHAGISTCHGDGVTE